VRALTTQLNYTYPPRQPGRRGRERGRERIRVRCDDVTKFSYLRNSGRGGGGKRGGNYEKKGGRGETHYPAVLIPIYHNLKKGRRGGKGGGKGKRGVIGEKERGGGKSKIVMQVLFISQSPLYISPESLTGAEEKERGKRKKREVQKEERKEANVRGRH